jgi:hypothetical protein
MKGTPPAHEGLTTIAAAMSHPLRHRILQAMNAPIRYLSPNEFSQESGHPLNNTAYHFRQLVKFGCIELVDTRQRRGATEHVFGPVRQAMLWTREWEELPPQVRKAISASVLRGFVENVGIAIDAGAFDEGDTHQAWGAFYADEEGEAAMLEILHNALADVLALEAEVTERLKREPERPNRLVSFGTVGFPSVPHPEPALTA